MTKENLELVIELAKECARREMRADYRQSHHDDMIRTMRAEFHASETEWRDATGQHTPNAVRTAKEAAEASKEYIVPGSAGE